MLGETALVPLDTSAMGMHILLEHVSRALRSGQHLLHMENWVTCCAQSAAGLQRPSRAAQRGRPAQMSRYEAAAPGTLHPCAGGRAGGGGGAQHGRAAPLLQRLPDLCVRARARRAQAAPRAARPGQVLPGALRGGPDVRALWCFALKPVGQRSLATCGWHVQRPGRGGPHQERDGFAAGGMMRRTREAGELGSRGSSSTRTRLLTRARQRRAGGGSSGWPSAGRSRRTPPSACPACSPSLTGRAAPPWRLPSRCCLGRAAARCVLATRPLVSELRLGRAVAVAASIVTVALGCARLCVQTWALQHVSPGLTLWAPVSCSLAER